MRDRQWQLLLDIITGKAVESLPVGFIIDSPWIPGWAGVSMLDYFANDMVWFEANRKAVESFEDVMFLPGFWAEFGMCTEPSAFGAKCRWQENEMPFAGKVLGSINDVDKLGSVNVETDGMGPFVLNRLKNWRRPIEKLGHKIRFAVSRGPLNIASFLMGTTEFLIALKTNPEKVHKLLEIITEYIISWLELQKSSFDSIDGVFILDDIVGFCGDDDFCEFVEPYLKDIFTSLDISAKFFHNDADGRVCSQHMADIGVNMFNFSFNHSLADMKSWTDNKVVLVGNVPPRDVLALGTPEDVEKSVKLAFDGVEDKSRIIVSCGGGMADGVSSDNIKTFLDTVGKI